MDVGRDPFAPYSGDLRNLRPKGTSLPFLLSLHFFSLLFVFFFLYIFIYINIFFKLSSVTCFTGIKRPSLSNFHRGRVHRARLHVERDFHSLVTLRCLAKWGLGPEPSDKAIAHEVIVRRSKFSFDGHLNILLYLLIYS